MLKKHDELQARIEIEKPDIICITEIKPKNGKPPIQQQLEIKGYDLTLNQAYNTDSTRGVCIYTKQSLHATPVMNTTTKLFEDSVWISIPGSCSKDLLIGCIYRSGSREKAVSLDKSMHQMICNMTEDRNYAEVLIVGDFNHPTVTWNPDPHIEQHHAEGHPDLLFVECLHDAYLHQHVNQPTRYREDQQPTTDDLILTSNELLIDDLTYSSHLGQSDHITLNFNIDFTTKPEPESTQTKTYRYHKTDVKKMKEMLDLDWESLLANKPIEEAYDTFLSKYEEAKQQCVPVVTNNGDSKFKKPIWMKYKTEDTVKKKQQAWRQYLKTKHPNKKEEYRRARNAATHQTTNDRKDFEKKLAAEVKTNNKAFWKYAASQRKMKKEIPPLKKKDGNLTANDQEKANALNEQFTSVFTLENKETVPEFEGIPVNTKLTSITVTEDTVLKRLQNLRVDKAPGPDDVHPYILKYLSETLAKPLTILFNLSLTETSLPQIWKKGIITALFKKGERNLASNYRPISLTSIICRVLERIIVEHIIKHLTENNIYDKKQHGFTAKKSTVSNLLEALNIWSEALSHHLPVDIIYLDLEKAFDKVPHGRLIQQLKRYGIEGSLLMWIEDFLSNRKQSVKVNGKTSDEQDVTSGVPQGSVLGPVLFLIYVSDISGLVNNFVSLFADDTKLFSYLLEEAAHDNEDEHTAESIQEDINTIAHWSEKMLMSFNIDKCHSLHLGSNNNRYQYTLPKQTNTKTSRNSTSYSYTFHNLAQVTEEKDLGVVVDDKLNFYSHIEEKVKKANQMLGIIKSTFKYIDCDIFSLLYKTLVRPHVEYASSVWSPHTKKHQEIIEKLQRRATKLVPELKHLSYEERLRKLKLPTLQYRRLRTDLMQIYKITHNMVNMDINTYCKICRYNTSMLQPVLRPANRGHPLKYQIQHHQGVRNRFLTSRALNFWNNLSEKTVTSISINSFKNNLSKDTSLPSQYVNF